MLPTYARFACSRDTLTHFQLGPPQDIPAPFDALRLTRKCNLCAEGNSCLQVSGSATIQMTEINI